MPRTPAMTQDSVTFNVPLVVWNKATVGGTRKSPKSFGQVYGSRFVSAEEKRKGRGWYMAVVSPRDVAEEAHRDLKAQFQGRQGTQGDEYQVRTSCGEIADRIAEALGLGVTVRQETKAAAAPSREAPAEAAPRRRRVDLDALELVPGPKVELATLQPGAVFFLERGHDVGPDVPAGPVVLPHPRKFIRTGWKRGELVNVGNGSASVRYSSNGATRTFTPDSGPNAGKTITIPVVPETVTVARSTLVFLGVAPDHPEAQE
jgi:hypothetical protein